MFEGLLNQLDQLQAFAPLTFGTCGEDLAVHVPLPSGATPVFQLNNHCLYTKPVENWYVPFVFESVLLP